VASADFLEPTLHFGKSEKVGISGRPGSPFRGFISLNAVDLVADTHTNRRRDQQCDQPDESPSRQAKGPTYVANSPCMRETLTEDEPCRGCEVFVGAASTTPASPHARDLLDHHARLVRKRSQRRSPVVLSDVLEVSVQELVDGLAVPLRRRPERKLER